MSLVFGRFDELRKTGQNSIYTGLFVTCTRKWPFVKFNILFDFSTYSNEATDHELVVAEKAQRAVQHDEGTGCGKKNHQYEPIRARV